MNFTTIHVKPVCTLVSNLFFFQNKDVRVDSKSPEGKQASKIEDVLIKVIRVVANLSINEEIGSAVASNEVCVKLLINVLGELYQTC